MMKMLIIHNAYGTTAASGEDGAVRNEQRMLESRGVEVVTFVHCKDDMNDSTLWAKTAVAANTIWSQRSRSTLRRLPRRVRPDDVHVHNTFAMHSRWSLRRQNPAS